ncbi:hypothetical protein SDRG_05073 [Saprolegnia diclina VS20]|uniref:Uncharacterized protein n=1 Tax=Saprolegnia diclina (strain VS20) TaxID=1156394 RepID=T0QU16_SAPDV|nr:hypothetical protein SDRG_05073 [Saprolegnia diclina VS20]EQC37470.1 hypothetical protein SDRG_05073 [Saprolegnia diclina VS20]|eukprot:XP_008608990.1 hypothetical protein SDRG_05073 [Saprolegnia diclina VS20]
MGSARQAIGFFDVDCGVGVYYTATVVWDYATNAPFVGDVPAYNTTMDVDTVCTDVWTSQASYLSNVAYATIEHDAFAEVVVANVCMTAFLNTTDYEASTSVFADCADGSVTYYADWNCSVPVVTATTMDVNVTCDVLHPTPLTPPATLETYQSFIAGCDEGLSLYAMASIPLLDWIATPSDSKDACVSSSLLNPPLSHRSFEWNATYMVLTHPTFTEVVWDGACAPTATSMYVQTDCGDDTFGYFGDALCLLPIALTADVLEMLATTTVACAIPHPTPDAS